MSGTKRRVSTRCTCLPSLGALSPLPLKLGSKNTKTGFFSQRREKVVLLHFSLFPYAARGHAGYHTTRLDEVHLGAEFESAISATAEDRVEKHENGVRFSVACKSCHFLFFLQPLYTAARRVIHQSTRLDEPHLPAEFKSAISATTEGRAEKHENRIGFDSLSVACEYCYFEFSFRPFAQRQGVLYIDRRVSVRRSCLF